ncbi:hypothetical protein MNBD_GAMMA12-799 [hydrothermal vent metagenome]|uniref:Outer-membrane lipoprotein LolB n=1 Tax=hydrothermal vent metagenome TaxID=652676 RepID=A0A3B0YZC0_9ZZZZ
MLLNNTQTLLKKIILLMAIVVTLQACDLKYLGGKRPTEQEGTVPSDSVDINTQQSAGSEKETKNNENSEPATSEKSNTPKVLDSKIKVTDRIAKLRLVSTWNIRGRVSIVTGNDGWGGSIRWKQVDANYDIRIVGPLGQGGIWLQGSPGFVELRSSKNKKPITATDAEALLYRQMGWKIPVSGMRYWVLGLYGPGKIESIKYNKEGLPSEFVQSGWTIRWSRYRKAEGMQFPAKIYLNNDRFRVKMIVKQWKLES